jgi:hypothetical protein
MSLVTEAEIRDAALKAQNIANELNTLLKTFSVRQLVNEGRVSFLYHPSVMDESHGGAEYMKGTVNWACYGAVEQLMNILDKEAPGKSLFCGGSFGSVWFDAHLTGGKGKYRRTKMVRVTPFKIKKGSWKIMLDNTFEEKW